MRIFTCAFLAVAIATACTSRNEAPPATDSTAPTTTVQDSVLPMRVLLNEFSSGMTDSTRVILRDSAAWADAYARVYMNHGRPPSVSNVDFTREMVVLVALGTRSSGGYSIGVDSARSNSADVRVYVRSTSPGPTCGTTAALTQPVHAVALSRTRLPVRFVETATASECR